MQVPRSFHDFLSKDADITATLTEDKGILASSELNTYAACVFGTGFTRTERREDGSVERVSDLAPAEEAGLFQFISEGKGLVGIHGTAWWIGGQAMELIGGASNWHPPGSTFTVHIEDNAHPTTQGVEDFDVEDEIYISAHDPHIHVLGICGMVRQSAPHGVGKALRFWTGLLHHFGTRPRDIRARRYAEIPYPGRKMGSSVVEFRMARHNVSPYACSNHKCQHSKSKP